MSGTEPIYDPIAERAVVAAAISNVDTVAELARLVSPLDFYEPLHQAAFEAAIARLDRGLPVDPMVIARDVDNVGGVTRLLDARVSPGAVGELAVRVAELAAARRVQALAVDGLADLASGASVADVRDRLIVGLDEVEMPFDPRPVEGLYSADEMLRADFPTPPPLIPGFLREQDRLLLVGVEGSGKSYLLRQLAAAAASGLDPFRSSNVAIPRQVPTLIVDAENPEYVIREGLEALRPYRPGSPLSILSRPGGLDVRSRRDRDLLQRVLEDVRPDFVVAGPLYKLYRTDPGESDEQAAMGCQNVFDDLRSRFGFALALEHHAPKGSAGAKRDLVPFGSSAWMRWPEFGWKLIPHDAAEDRDKVDGLSLRLAGFRGDRVKIDRPLRFDRSPIGWPWAAIGPDGFHRDVNDPGPRDPGPFPDEDDAF